MAPKLRWLLTLATVVLTVSAVAAPGVASPRLPAAHPSIAALHLSPATVAHGGGTVHLTTTVHHATKCKVSSSPSLSGLPLTHSCTSGHLHVTLHVGADPHAALRHIVVTVKASKGSHHKTKTVTLTQSAAPAPSVTGFAVSPTHLASPGGTVHLTATVKNASSCKLSAAPALAGLPATVSCTSSAFSHAVALPADATATAHSYLFTLIAQGAGGSRTAATHPMATVAAAAATTPISSITAVAAPVPAGANVGAESNAVLSAVACPSAGHCIAVGAYYSPPTGSETVNESGLIETLSGTTWTASAGPLPTDISTTEPAIALDSVSCSGSTACVAVGYYLADNQGHEPYVATLSGTTWTWQPASVPADGQNRIGGQLLSVSCAPGGGCVAVGESEPPGDEEDALIEQPSVGGWAGSEAPLPSNADPEESYGTEIQDILYDVSCTSSTSCSAVGEYTLGTGPTLSTAGVADTLSGSTWAATQLAPTADEGYDSAVSCGSELCEGTGDYSTSTPEIQTEASGTWNPSNAIAAPQPTTFNGTDLYGVDCTAGTSCVLVGTANNVATGTYALIDDGSDSTYSDVAAPLPSNEGSSPPRSSLAAVACGAAGSCMAVGFYNGTDTQGYYDGLLETETTADGTSTWTPAEVPLPSGDFHPGTLKAVSCVAVWGCVSVGVMSPTGSNAVGEIVVAPL